MTEYVVTDPRNAWQPPSNVRDHTGQPLVDGLVFFAAPPQELGKIISASSTLRAGTHPWPGAFQFLLSTIPAAVLAVVMIRLRDQYFYVIPRSVAVAVALVTAALLLVIFRWFITFRQECSYAGEHGVARLHATGKEFRVSKEEKLIFSEASELHARMEKLFIHGIYVGSDFNFIWTNPLRKKLLWLAGKFRNKKGQPETSHHLYHFTMASESAWNDHFRHRLANQLERHGHVDFAIGKKDWIRVGPGFLETTLRVKQQRLAASEIKGFKLQSGTFFVIHGEKKRFGRYEGVWKIQYAELANAKLFFLAIERLLGMTFASNDTSSKMGIGV